MGTAPRRHRVVRRAETGVRPVMRGRRDFTDREVHRSDVSNRDQRRRGADTDLDIEVARLIPAASNAQLGAALLGGWSALATQHRGEGA